MTNPEKTVGELETVHTQWKELKGHVKDCELKKKEILDQIQNYMMETGTGQLELQNGSFLELRTRKTKVPLNQNELTRILTIAFQGDHAKASEMTTFILKERATKETTYLHFEDV